MMKTTQTPYTNLSSRIIRAALGVAVIIPVLSGGVDPLTIFAASAFGSVMVFSAMISLRSPESYLAAGVGMASILTMIASPATGAQELAALSVLTIAAVTVALITLDKKHDDELSLQAIGTASVNEHRYAANSDESVAA